jgi:flagellar biosynthesis protein FlhF
MRLKRYYSSEVRQAIREIREDLGPDAVIISNRKVDGRVELTAAIDYDDSWLEGQQQDTNDIAITHPVPATEHDSRAVSAALEHSQSRQRAVPVSERANPEHPALTAVGRELSTLRGLLEHQVSALAWGDQERLHPLRMVVLRQLMDLGLSRPLAQAISAEIPEQVELSAAWQAALQKLGDGLQVIDDGALMNGGIFALLGPTGVGKTTTIAKLAARFALRNRAEDIALITTDSYRVGAHEQLRRFGQIMQIPVRVASDEHELNDSLEHFRGRRLILIDTAGMSQRDVRFARQLTLIRGGDPTIKAYLVLSATTQRLGLEQAVRAFCGEKLDGGVITKIDEAIGLGGVLSVLIQNEIPVAYVSNGQRVPEDIEPANSHALVKAALTIAQEMNATSQHEAEDSTFAGMKANAQH